jgi:hypothetical protein
MCFPTSLDLINCFASRCLPTFSCHEQDQANLVNPCNAADCVETFRAVFKQSLASHMLLPRYFLSGSASVPHRSKFQLLLKAFVGERDILSL